MNLKELTATINKYVEDLDFGTARVYLEENLTVLNENKNKLNSNARALLEFISDRQQEGVQPLTRKDMSIINATNSYASKFDLRGLKVLVRDNSQLFLRSDISAYINADAKIILEGMGSIKKPS
ncbi:hypothetical protein M3204_03565 [Mesobacillus subterraneus]|uniref:hypothetical protein n=1 Tax=Mesobacillus subterraneus TaxID=285983 RepID=UPI0020421B9A|nr:hypothetical protein [Mesobacillus subterraneus]MCM3683235.1 hypothetical protein [Mesobacillus subterraneus]